MTVSRSFPTEAVTKKSRLAIYINSCALLRIKNVAKNNFILVHFNSYL